MRGVFVTGTGTEVGKTVVAAALANTARVGGEALAAFKPAVSGLDDHPPALETWENAPELPDHALLRLAARSQQSDDEIAPYRYGPAVSPHLAAELDGETIDPDLLRRRALAAAERADLLICEGVGGLMVPLIHDYLVRDLACDLGFPVVIAASPALGTINHTLLTIDAARAAGLEVVGVVLTPWPAEPSSVERSNKRTIERLGSAQVATLPRLDLTAPRSWPALRLAAPERQLRAA
ncbi:MAG: dethiobiotin synthase [Solirubrobacterales bacterium]